MVNGELTVTFAISHLATALLSRFRPFVHVAVTPRVLRPSHSCFT